MFDSLVLFPASGNLKLRVADDALVEIHLSPEEQDQLRNICLSFYRNRCGALANQVATGGPALPPPDAEFTEVPF